MQFVHAGLRAGPEDLVVVNLDRQANALLLDDQAFSAYRNGSAFRYYGGWATRSPVRLRPPHSGHWHVVVDLGGLAGTVRATVRLISAQKGRLVQGALF